MEITSRGRYAMLIMEDIALKEGFVSISEISTKHGISTKYLEKIMTMLVKANLVKSARGSLGGYALSKPANQITIKEILDATGDGAKIVDCISAGCSNKENCHTYAIWNTLKELIENYLSGISLLDLIKKSQTKKS